MKKAIKLLIILLIAFSLISCEFTNNKINEDVKIYERQENKIYFGVYPQRLVTDNELITDLNEVSGSLPTPSNSYNWVNYNYPPDATSSFLTCNMFYQDIDLDNDGAYDYRGVYFTQYRPCWTDNSSSSDRSYQDDNNYLTNTVYWFSYDPIEWDILKEENGKALIIANLILDSQDYYFLSIESPFSHNGGIGYSNNYELSNIRKFLNEDFYNTAFTKLQKAIIETTEVDNSKTSTGDTSNLHICNNTFDKMFILSKQEAETYYPEKELRIARGTDYAKSQGLYVLKFDDTDDTLDNSGWWLRSPHNNSEISAYEVNWFGRIGDYATRYTDCGVRPCCWIALK